MKRTFALVMLLASLGALIKLAARSGDPTDQVLARPVTTVLAGKSSIAEGPRPLVDRYRNASPRVREMVARLVERFGRNAEAIDRTDGERGLVLLDRLDMEALVLYEKYPADFRRLREILGTDAAADLLLHWREYFGLKRGDETDRGILIAELAALSPSQRRAAARFPAALPLILAEPDGVVALIDRLKDDRRSLTDALTILGFISLEKGAAELRSALRTLEHFGPSALEAFRGQGLEGFALVSLYGPILEAMGDAMPLDQALIVLSVNAHHIDAMLQTQRPEAVAGHLRHVVAAGLAEAVGGSPRGLRLVVEQGEPGEQALRRAGPDAADVVFGDFVDATLRRQATLALAEHGPMALAMLDKYSTDPDFREVLRTYGAAAIPPIARADVGPETIAFLQSKDRRSFREAVALSALSMAGENGQATIRTIREAGLERVVSLDDGSLSYYQFLPLYDVIHLGNVMRQGYAPTSGELTWAMIDGCFAIADVLSLTAMQPEGAMAAEVARSEVKAATRAGVRSAVEGASTATERMARWWAIRSAGGVYQILRRMPEALPRLNLSRLSSMAEPLCERAGMKLTNWRPVRFLKDGAEVVFRIPPERGLKYLSAQMVQAGVGVVGFQKMEEHLRSRRPNPPVVGRELIP